MARYKCKVSSTNGLINQVVDLPANEHTRELERRGIVEPVREPEPKVEKPKAKKGGSAQEANPTEKVETKA